MTTYTSQFVFTGSDVTTLQELLDDCKKYLSSNPGTGDQRTAATAELHEFIRILDAGTRDANGETRQHISASFPLSELSLEFISLAHKATYQLLSERNGQGYPYILLLRKMDPKMSSFVLINQGRSDV